VFDASFAHGALVLDSRVAPSSRQVVLFDPFFGGVLARTPLSRVSTTLLTDATASRALALEPGDFAAGQPAYVHLIDLSTGLVTSSVTLPSARYTGQWIANLDRTMAYIVWRDDVAAQFFVERFDLANALDLGPLPIGLAGFENVVDATAGPQSVYLQSQRPPQFPSCSSVGALSQIDETGGGPIVTTTPWGDGLSRVLDIVAAPVAGVFAFRSHEWCSPGGAMALARLSDPTASGRPILPPPGSGVCEPGYVAPLVAGVWLSTEGDATDDALWFADYSDLVGHSWSLTKPSDPPFYEVDIVGIDATEDRLGERACVLLNQFTPVPQIWADARLSIVDRATASVTHVDLGPSPATLLTVPIP
jgi:hypothetical protein